MSTTELLSPRTFLGRIAKTVETVHSLHFEMREILVAVSTCVSPINPRPKQKSPVARRNLRAIFGILGHDRRLGAEAREGGPRAPRRRGRLVSELLQGGFVEVERDDADALQAAHEAVCGRADEERAQERQAGADDAEGGLDHWPVDEGRLEI